MQSARKQAGGAFSPRSQSRLNYSTAFLFGLRAALLASVPSLSLSPRILRFKVFCHAVALFTAALNSPKHRKWRESAQDECAAGAQMEQKKRKRQRAFPGLILFIILYPYCMQSEWITKARARRG
jgi:hypothetical protein